MLEFDQGHKVADLSAIKFKTEKTKKIGKVRLCGIMLSGVLLLSGCGRNVTNINQQTDVTQQNTSSTAIIMENGNAMIVDVIQIYSFRTYSVDHLKFNDSKISYVLTTVSGDELIVDYNNFKLISGEDSHEKAETIAQALISENGEITCYDEIESYGKTR